jgi:hypothetical protein
VKSGGVKVLVMSCESKISQRQLETSTRTLLRIASSNSQSIRELVQDGAIQALIGTDNAPNTCNICHTLCLMPYDMFACVAP